MLRRCFEDTVSALTYSLIREHGGPPYSPLHNQVVRFVLEQHGRVPDHLRVPLLAFTCVFDVAALVGTGQPFHRLTPERRRRQLRAWRTARLGVCRDLVRFYETLVVFGWTSLVREQA
jgi:hypothetical protein